MRMPGEAGPRVPAPPADGARRPAEHDRLGGRPQRRPETTATSASTGSRATRRSSGPVQIEARIDQDPLISSQITLWSQAGSKVIRGNLIVVPVQDSIIYLEPIYLQSTGSAIPEFTKIVVASPTKVVWGDTLEEALTLLLAGRADARARAPTPTPGAGRRPPTPVPTASPGASPRCRPTSQALVRYANEHFEAAQEALRRRRLRDATARRSTRSSRTLAQLELVTGGSATPVP